MSRQLSEKQVLEMLGIPDFRHLSKEWIRKPRKAPTAPTRSRSTRPRLGCWNVTGWRTRTFPTKSNRGEPKSGTLEVRRCVTLH